MFHYLVILIFLSISALQGGERKNIGLILEEIPDKDKESLEEFFRHLTVNECFGYVIFGDKPMVLSSLYSKSLILVRKQAKVFIYNPLWNDSIVWKQYQSLFPMKDYTLRISTLPSNHSKYHYEIIFINRKTCLETIQNNIDLFKQKLGSSITAEEMLHRLETKEDILKEALNNHEDLLGILLGFGRHNSELYQARDELDKAGRYSPPYANIKEVYTSQLTTFNPGYNNILTFIKYPNFVVDEKHPETIQVRQKFIQTQKKLCQIYSQGHFLEITLNALSQQTK